MLTRRANRLRNAPSAAAETATVTGSTTSLVDAPVTTADVVPAPVVSDAVVPAPVVAIIAEPLSRRARRLAHAKSQLAADDVPDAAVVPDSSIRDADVFEDDVRDAASPDLVPVPAAEQPATPLGTADVDAFAQASSAFGFSPVSETAVQVPARETPATPASAHLAPRRRVRRRMAAAGASLGVMGVAGLIAVSMTLPASAVAAVQGGDAGASASLVASGPSAAPKLGKGEIQAFVASDVAQGESLARSDEYSTISLLDVAAEENIQFSDSLYTNDPDAAIQWPFMVGVAMSSGYGMRNGRMHEGIDLVPGNGATIQSIADGTVRIATESGGAYGVTVYIDHIIDGKLITSHYSHMQRGSLAVRVGQQVKVGQPLGRVGTTGRSTGPHLHFELIVNGARIDPLPWLRKNAGRYSY